MFQFLNDTQRYAIQLPDGYAVLDAMVTMRLGEHGNERQLVYRPGMTAWESDPSGFKRERDVNTTEGPPATVYAQLAVPGVKTVVWQVKTGDLTLNFNPDEETELDTYLDRLKITDEAAPHVVLEPPLQAGDPREPFQRDQIAFSRRYGTEYEETISVQRLPAGKREDPALMVANGWVLRNAFSGLGFMVAWGGPAAQREFIETSLPELARSLVRAG